MTVLDREKVKVGISNANLCSSGLVADFMQSQVEKVGGADPGQVIRISTVGPKGYKKESAKRDSSGLKGPVKIEFKFA